MLTDVQRDYLAKSVRLMQIIVGALAGGVLVFLVICLVAVNRNAAADPLITYVAVGFAAVAIVAWIVVPGIMVSQGRKAIAEGRAPALPAQAAAPPEVGDVAPLAIVFQTKLIIASAILEGAAFFNLVAYMVEAQYLSLGTAIAFLLMMLSQFPTLNRLEDWVSRELEAIESMRA